MRWFLPFWLLASSCLTLSNSLTAADLFVRRIPRIVEFTKLNSTEVLDRAVPLPEADTRPFLAIREIRSANALQTSRPMRAEIVLVKIRGRPHVAAIHVETGREPEALGVLQARPDVEFAELDFFQKRQFMPDDSRISNQWHHAIIGSFAAWDINLGQPFIRIGIVDSPFQMDHPDLVAHTAAGWDVVTGMVVTNSSGIAHSTFCAGLAGAVINNHLGVAGTSNCQIVPINISGAISEMYAAIVWAADHDIRVVNVSWTGGDSATLNAAGAYLKSTARGILAMAGGNLGEYSVTTNQPNIYCISMTDAADNFSSLSSSGAGIDFAAPGDAIFSTTIGGAYTSGTGTSYSTPVFCGVVAELMSINPTLNADEIIEILKTTAKQLGGFPQGTWNSSYGWGRITFGAAAAATAATLPRISGIAASPGLAIISIPLKTNVNQVLYRNALAISSNWTRLNAIYGTNRGVLTLADPSPLPGRAFYKVQAETP